MPVRVFEVDQEVEEQFVDLVQCVVGSVREGQVGEVHVAQEESVQVRQVGECRCVVF